MILTNSCKKVLNNFIQQYTIIENQRINLHALSMTDDLEIRTFLRIFVSREKQVFIQQKSDLWPSTSNRK